MNCNPLLLFYSVYYKVYAEVKTVDELCQRIRITSGTADNFLESLYCIAIFNIDNLYFYSKNN